MRFFNLVHSHQKEISALKSKIEKIPENWQRYEYEVARLIDSVFDLCRNFERQFDGNERKISKMKKIFNINFAHYFRLGRLGRMVIDKPFGYHGDFMIIDEIYKNDPMTMGVERCLDNYFLKTAASIATRNRKEDFKTYLGEIINARPEKIRIMDLASGPCRDVRELLESDANRPRVAIDCIDHDMNAISYGKAVLGEFSKSINFFQKNAMRMALVANIPKYFLHRYDAIYSTGLFDYLDDEIAIMLLKNLRKLLKDDGIMIISNYCDKWQNPSRHYMDWGGGWSLHYRTETDFLGLFLAAGFANKNLLIRHESQRVMQYCFART